MPDETKQQASPYPSDESTGKQESAPKPQPGQYAMHWYSPFPNVLDSCSPTLKAKMKELCDLIGNKDVAARRFEVEQSWEARLFDRGYQFLLPRRGGGWEVPNLMQGGGKNNRRKYFGYETNIYTTYGEILTAALTRDVPGVRFFPRNPENGADVTASDAATKYARCFSQSNDLTNFQHQMVYYLRNDGRAVIVTDYVLDGQRFGWEPSPKQAVPENESEVSNALVYLVRHGETDENADDLTREPESELTENGDAESHQAAEWLESRGVKQIVSSPLPRAMQSAGAIADKTGVTPSTDDRFAALDIGDFAAQPKEQADPEIEQYAANPDEPIPGGESFTDFGNRIQGGLFELIQSAEGGNGPIAVVMHDSGITQVARIITGDDEITPDVVAPGGIIAIVLAEGGGYALKPVFGQASPAIEQAEDRIPRGQECAEVYGKLEAKVPINADTMSDFPFLQVSKEYDVALVKAMWPERADEIKPGYAGAGENELDRIARINARLSLEASYVTGDSMVRDCTIQRTWMRPSFFYEIKETELREEALQAFPDGCLVIMAGETTVCLRNEGMDDHCTVVQANPGSGQNRISLMDKVLSVQKRLNNWIDLLNAYFVKCVPMKWMASPQFDVQQVKQQGNTPGGIGQFQFQPGVMPEQLIMVEPTPQPQAMFWTAILFFVNELPQLLSGATAAIFGAESNQDSWRGAALQADQALGRLGTPWHAIRMATCSYFRQAVQLAARCRQQRISASLPGGEVVNIELGDLKGNVLAYPEDDSNFPESWNQRQQRLQQLMMDATNPVVQTLLQLPKNLRLVKDAVGLSELEIPQVTAYEKQLGEFKVLLNSAPMPNPQMVQERQAFAQQTASYETQVMRHGGMRDAQAEANIGQMGQQIQQMPPFVPSLQIDSDDLHDAEAAACLDWMMSPEGRSYKNGTAKERLAYMNVKLHRNEHVQAAAAQKAADQAIQPVKPPTKSIAIKDLPPGPAAKLAAQGGIAATPEDFAAQEAVEAPSAR